MTSWTTETEASAAPSTIKFLVPFALKPNNILWTQGNRATNQTKDILVYKALGSVSTTLNSHSRSWTERPSFNWGVKCSILQCSTKFCRLSLVKMSLGRLLSVWSSLTQSRRLKTESPIQCINTGSANRWKWLCGSINNEHSSNLVQRNKLSQQTCCVVTMLPIRLSA